MAQTKWSKEMIVGMIGDLRRQNIDLSSRNVFKNYHPLYSAACRYLGGWANAVWIAGINYDQVLNQGKASRREKLKRWSKKRIQEEIKDALSINPFTSYEDKPALYSAARREFRSWKEAVKQAGCQVARKGGEVKLFRAVSKANPVEKESERGSVLVVDDDIHDCLLIRTALKANGVENPVRFFEDGRALVDHLSKNLKESPPDQVTDLPSLIVMDINMPHMNGHEALKILKGDPQLKEIPVVILSSSSDLKDIDHSYQEGANSFFSKPPDYLELVSIMGLLKNNWLQQNPLSSAGA
jgi:CheY-like chemotaxis protein